MYYFYLLQSLKRLKEIYTGSTNDLKLRIAEHNKGKVFSTKRYLPWRLVYYEAYASEKDARLREQKFKKHGKSNQELKKRLGNSLKKGEGFTLIELIISVAIMAILTTVVIANFKSDRQNKEIDLVKSDLVNKIMELKAKMVAGGGFINNQGVNVFPKSYYLIVNNHGYTINAILKDASELAVENKNWNDYVFSINPVGCYLSFDLTNETSSLTNCQPGLIEAAISISVDGKNRDVIFNSDSGKLIY